MKEKKLSYEKFISWTESQGSSETWESWKSKNTWCMYVTRGNPSIREVLGVLEFEGHIIKKFIIFDQFQWNFVHSINTLLEYFSKVSLKIKLSNGFFLSLTELNAHMSLITWFSKVFISNIAFKWLLSFVNRTHLSLKTWISKVSMQILHFKWPLSWKNSKNI